MEREEGLLTVGEVVERLKSVDPTITVSKLHFYEKEGLISPERTPGGHRLYCSRTVERLRLILLLRTRLNLPIGTIKRLLDSLERDPALQLLATEWTIDILSIDPSFEPMPEEEAKAASGLSEEQFSEVRRLQIVIPCSKTGLYHKEAVETLRVIKDLIDMGLKIEDLVPYREHIDALLEHEECLFGRLPKEREEVHLGKYHFFREKLAQFRRFLFLNHLRRTLQKMMNERGERQ
jgi:DNA-binding transcriptional MerR regulator